MNVLEFVMHLDDDRIVQAIREAELRTSGEVRVYVSKEKAPDPLDSAIGQFHRMGMRQTRERNGVLVFVAPKSQTFAIVGDEGIHQKCGPDFWNAIVDEMRTH